MDSSGGMNIGSGLATGGADADLADQKRRRNVYIYGIIAALERHTGVAQDPNCDA